jgi:prepilin-type N-terminal cleavage/methylation domain-containing protein
MKTASTFRHGFTLIELLIVVAIIAILAAIAVPNFLEAQTRAKVSRLVSDFRTVRVGLESYRVDANRYPETDVGGQYPRGLGMFRLTTPVSYLTSIAKSPFREEKMGSGTPARAATQLGLPLYVRALVHPGGDGDGNSDGISDSYVEDRGAYLILPNQPGFTGQRTAGEYMIKSVGPDNIDNRDPNPPNQYIFPAFSYDPTNGTVSDGDIVTFSDTTINAGGK